MKKVKYYFPDIQVRCITEYCRKGELAKITGSTDDYKAVDIQYLDDSTDVARICHDDSYDLEFVHEEDELLQEAMERYNGKSFKSLAGTDFENFKPVKARWTNVIR